MREKPEETGVMGYYTKYLGQEFGFGDLVDLSEKIEQAQKAAGKTLIGTCGDCDYWKPLSKHFADTEDGECLARNRIWHKYDGCKKWKEISND